jgi:hypothetical protein
MRLFDYNSGWVREKSCNEKEDAKIGSGRTNFAWPGLKTDKKIRNFSKSSSGKGLCCNTQK